MVIPSVIPYPAYVPCPGSLKSSDLFNHVCDLCLFSYPHFFFLSRYAMFNILLSIFVCVAARLFFAWMVSAHVSAPYVIAVMSCNIYNTSMLSLSNLYCQQLPIPLHLSYIQVKSDFITPQGPKQSQYWLRL